MDVGFIGLGIMGRPMAGHLAKGGHTLHLFSRSGVPQDLLAAGGRPCGNGKDVPSPDVRWVLFGSDRNGVMQLYVARADGTQARTVTNVPAGSCAMHGHWQPAH